MNNIQMQKIHENIEPHNETTKLADTNTLQSRKSQKIKM